MGRNARSHGEFRYLDSARFEETIDLAELGLNLLGDHWIREDAGPRIAQAEMIEKRSGSSD